MRTHGAVVTLVTAWMVLLITAPPATAATGPSISEWVLGEDRCTWEPERPGSFVAQPQKQDATACEQYATGQGYIFTGSGDSAWVAATEEPTTACACGATAEKWFFIPSGGQYSCMGFRYSCTEPGTGCRWVRAGSDTLDAATSEECRTKALAHGAYLGWNAKAAASKTPACGCVCGESRTQWYAENNAGTNWQFVCKAFRYRCLGPARITPRLPREVLDGSKP